MSTLAQRNANQRIHRKLTGNAETHRYEKTPYGFLMRLYRNMQSRIVGVQKQKWHLYKGKELLPREQFYKWATNSPEFYALYTDWRRANYDRKLTPSVDRIDPSSGYTLKNMRWITHSENSRLGAISSARDGHWKQTLPNYINRRSKSSLAPSPSSIKTNLTS